MHKTYDDASTAGKEAAIGCKEAQRGLLIVVSPRLTKDREMQVTCSNVDAVPFLLANDISLINVDGSCSCLVY